MLAVSLLAVETGTGLEERRHGKVTSRYSGRRSTCESVEGTRGVTYASRNPRYVPCWLEGLLQNLISLFEDRTSDVLPLLSPSVGCHE